MHKIILSVPLYSYKLEAYLKDRKWSIYWEDEDIVVSVLPSRIKALGDDVHRFEQENNCVIEVRQRW